MTLTAASRTAWVYTASLLPHVRGMATGGRGPMEGLTSSGRLGRGFFGGFGGGSANSGKKEEGVDLYKVLGVPKSASELEIKKAYRQLALKHHPDVGGDDKKFKEINAAYDVLSNRDKRAQYDQYGLDGLKRGAGGMGDFDDIFGAFFGGRTQSPTRRKVKPTLQEIQVTLEDIFAGRTIQLDNAKTVICEDCDGKGGEGVQKCGECEGSGSVTKMTQLGPGMYQRAQMACPKCKGEGEIIDPKKVCKCCSGKKVVQKTKKVDVSIEPGCPSGHTITYRGEGNEIPGAEAGDLEIKIQNKQHSIFTRNGADLTLEKQITMKQAFLGFSFTVKHLNGKDLLVSTIPGEVVEEGASKTLRGKGLPFYGEPTKFGNLHIKFKVVFPKGSELTQEQRDLISKVGSS